MIKSLLAPNPIDRPVLAKIIIDPLFREFITLLKYNGRSTLDPKTNEGYTYCDYNGFQIRPGTFAGQRKYKDGKV